MDVRISCLELVHLKCCNYKGDIHEIFCEARLDSGLAIKWVCIHTNLESKILEIWGGWVAISLIRSFADSIMRYLP